MMFFSAVPRERCWLLVFLCIFILSIHISVSHCYMVRTRWLDSMEAIAGYEFIVTIYWSVRLIDYCFSYFWLGKKRPIFFKHWIRRLLNCAFDVENILVIQGLEYPLYFEGVINLAFFTDKKRHILLSLDIFFKKIVSPF